MVRMMHQVVMVSQVQQFCCLFVGSCSRFCSCFLWILMVKFFFPSEVKVISSSRWMVIGIYPSFMLTVITWSLCELLKSQMSGEFGISVDFVTRFTGFRFISSFNNIFLGIGRVEFSVVLNTPVKLSWILSNACWISLSLYSECGCWALLLLFE